MSAPRWCPRCDSSGTIEGPDPGWYELDCPDCRGTGTLADEHDRPLWSAMDK